jgi:uncharacterized repeat protein (TIGR01451 family)
MEISKLLFLGMLVAAVAMPAMATQSPADCLDNTYVLTLGKSVTYAYDETHPLGPSTVSFDVDTGNPNSTGDGCDCSDVDTVLTTPDGVPHTCETGTDYPVGTAVTFLCSESYIVNSADVVGGVVTASANSTGVLDDTPGVDDPLDVTKTVSIVIINPSTVVTISADPVNGPCTGYTTTLTITETNTGDIFLTNAYVQLKKDEGGGEVLLQTLDETDGTWSSSGNGDDVLDAGETWSWTYDDTVTVDPTIYVARGYGTDPLGNVISYPTFTGEKDQVTVGCQEVPQIDVTKTVNCDISKAGDEVIYQICIENTGNVTVWPTVINDTVLGDLLPYFEGEPDDDPYGCFVDGGDLYLLPGETCCLDFPYTVQPGDPDPLVNVVTFEAEDEFAQAAGPVTDDATVDIVHPSFIASKDCRTDPLEVGDTAIFDIRIENDGDVCLRFDLTELGDPCSFDLPAGGVKEWETHIEVLTEEDIYNEVVGTAILIPGDPPEQCGEPTDCLDNVLVVDVNDICEVGGGATRTPGYWKTHSYMAKCMFDMCYPDGIDFGWTDVNDVNELMAVFYASKSKVNKICQARLQLSFHMGAAILNNCLPNGLPFEAHTGETFEGLAAIMAGCDIKAIQDKIGIVGAYNEYGDDVEIIWPEGMCDDLPSYNATPAVSKEWAEADSVDITMDECQACMDEKVTGKGKNK